MRNSILCSDYFDIATMKRKMDRKSASRIQASTAQNSGGNVSKKSFASRAQRAASKNEKSSQRGNGIESNSRQVNMEANNHSNQLNPNNDSFWQARGLDKRPDDWKERVMVEKDKG